MKRAESFTPTVIGLFCVFFFSVFLYFTPGPVKRVVDFLERATYDWRVVHYHKRLPADSPIIIVDIDDESLNNLGRWPWKRSVLAELVSKLFAAGAREIVFDAMFPEISDASDDAAFAKALEKGPTILGFVLKDSDETFGVLPKPLLQDNDSIIEQIQEKKGYISNIAPLQAAAAGAGVLNAAPDSDGVLRSTPVLMRKEGAVYGSLGLMGAFYYLGSPKVELVSALYRNQEVLEGVSLGGRFVPTDSSGKMLIPFRGLPYSFPYISANVVMTDGFNPKEIEDKLVFIGTSATSLGDLNPTAIFPIFAGVEIQASVAQGILDGYLPYHPNWALGAEALILLVFGTFSAFAFPAGNLVIRLALAFGLPAILLMINEMIWSSFGIVLSMVFPVAIVETLFLMNLIWGYFFESKRRHQIRALFSQYISNDRIDQILSSAKDVELQGESKELTVLFADIRGFTSIAEKLEAPELKALLTDFFTPMTEVIFKHKGTIDKYVGDLVMAFWGAPIEDLNHSLHAVECAIEMQKRLADLDTEWKASGKKEIHIGIGINTGVMSVGDMGSRFRKAYTVLGDPVNLASRLESLSKNYGASIVVGENTYKKTKDKIGYRKLDRVKVLGKEKAVEIFEPLNHLDHLTEQEKRKIEEATLALDAYFAKKWDVAKELFAKISDLEPIWANIFLRRIQEHIKNPPPENWDGAFVLENK